MKSDLSCKMKTIAEFMGEEIENYNEYMDQAEKWSDVPVLKELFFKNANKHEQSFQELYTLLNEYMGDLKEEMESIEITHIPNMPNSKSPNYNRRS